MISETDGIILRQIKIADDKRMLTIFTRKYGKIGAGTGIKTNGKNKSALAVRAFTHGRYSIYSGRNSYSIDSAETIESFYAIGEDIDKFMSASYALELTDRMLNEQAENIQALDLLLNLMRMLVKRKKDSATLITVYKWKLLALCGYAPRLDVCAVCGKSDMDEAFSITDGGMICSDCKKSKPMNMRLIYDLKFDIIPTLKYIYANPLQEFERLSLASDITMKLDEIFREYISYYLDIENIKSECYI